MGVIRSPALPGDLRGAMVADIMRLWLPFVLALSLPLAAACGGDDDDSTGPTCGTQAAPEILKVTDVTPAAGSTVEGRSTTQSFRIVGSPGMIKEVSFQPAANHTAGSPTPPSVTINVQQDGLDLVYTFEEVTWASAGHVELSNTLVYQVGGCFYALPKPLFSYDVTDSGNAGGSGGSAGSGGSGGASAGTSGAGGTDAGAAGVGGTAGGSGGASAGTSGNAGG